MARTAEHGRQEDISAHAGRVPRGSSRGQTVHRGARPDERCPQVALLGGRFGPAGPLRTHVGPPSSLRTYPYALRGENEGELPTTREKPLCEQDSHVHAPVVISGIYGGGCLRIHGQLRPMCAQPRGKATHDRQPEHVSCDGNSDELMY